MEDFQKANPLVFLLGAMALGFVFVGKYITPGVSYRKRRQLARARAAKKRKNRRRKR